jgi:membrane protein DedA with SNARE-associated domain
MMMMSDAFGFWQWVGLLLFWAVFLIPLWRIISKAGYSGAWALVSLIPVVNLIALWIFAFAKWPNERLRRDDVRPYVNQ